MRSICRQGKIDGFLIITIVVIVFRRFRPRAPFRLILIIILHWRVLLSVLLRKLCGLARLLIRQPFLVFEIRHTHTSYQMG